MCIRDRIYGNSDFYLTLDAATALDLDTCCSTQSTCIPSTVEGTLDQHHLLWRRAVHSLAKPINDQQNTSTASPDTQTTSIDTSISLTRPSTAHATPGTIRKTTWNFTGAQWQDFTESASYSVNLDAMVQLLPRGLQEDTYSLRAVSYTHLTLPTKRIV